MPIIVYTCECKNQIKKFHRQPKDAPSLVTCPSCSGNAKRSLSAPALKATVTIDNGHMSRSIEVDPNIIAINEERSKKDYTQE